MGSERLSMIVLMVVMVMGGIEMQRSDAQTTTHNVGGPIGWSIPTRNANAYTTWAASQTFKVGDVLVFNFTTGTHTAAEVTKAAYDACTISNPITVWNNGPSNVPLNTSGAHYYLCTVPGHCTAGQKLAITVAAAASPTPAPTPSATPPTPTPSATPTPTPSPTPAPTPSSSPSPSPASAPTPSGTPTPAPGSSATPSGPAPGSTATPSGVPAPGAADTPPDSPSSASFLSAALPLTFLSIAFAFYY